MKKKSCHDLFLTTNVPLVYMAKDVMILMQANPFRGPLKWVYPEDFHDQPLPMARLLDFPPSKSLSASAI
jgi:hypothetical protein